MWSFVAPMPFSVSEKFMLTWNLLVKSIDKSLSQISLFDYLQVTVVCLLLQDMTGFHHFFGTALFLIYFDKMKIRLFLEWKVWVAVKNIETQQLFNKTNILIFKRKKVPCFFHFVLFWDKRRTFKMFSNNFDIIFHKVFITSFVFLCSNLDIQCCLYEI